MPNPILKIENGEPLPQYKRRCGIKGCKDKCHTFGVCLRHWSNIRNRKTIEARPNEEEVFSMFTDIDGPVAKNKPELGRCWLWIGYIDKSGHGRFQRANKNRQRADMWMWSRMFGEIPSKMTLDHFACCNKACVNPHHSRLISSSEKILSGNGICARHARKTQCPHGHPYSKENTIICRSGRMCRECTRVKRNISRRIHSALRHYKKSDSTMKLVGCSLGVLKRHIESQFTTGMSWDNYGQFGWHIDHKIPCAAFDLNEPSQQRKCFHYTNLQPLWWHDNVSQRDKGLARVPVDEKQPLMANKLRAAA